VITGDRFAFAATRPFRQTLCLALLAVSLTSCSSAPLREPSTSATSPTGLSIEDAEATAVDVMNKVAAEVPEAAEINREQPDIGTWQSCDATRHSWAGYTRIVLQPGTDIDAILDVVEHRWSRVDSFSVDRTIFKDGTSRIDISGPGDSLYLVRQEQIDYLRIAAFSPCLTLPEGMTPGDDF